MTVAEFIAGEWELYRRCLAPVSDAFSMAATELDILLFLANNPGYDTAKQIAENRHLAKSHVSVSLRSLEERGFLKKEYRNGDRRTEHLVLLESSGEAVRAGREAQARYRALLTEGFSETELEELGRCFDRIHENVRRALNGK